MSVKIVNITADEFAKGIKKAAKKCPEIMKDITTENPELIKANGKLSKKAVKNLLISEDVYTPSGNLTKTSKKAIKQKRKELNLPKKVKNPVDFIASLAAIANKTSAPDTIGDASDVIKKAAKVIDEPVEELPQVAKEAAKNIKPGIYCFKLNI